MTIRLTIFAKLVNEIVKGDHLIIHLKIIIKRTKFTLFSHYIRYGQI